MCIRDRNVIADGAGAHNSIYRGKNLGTSVTAEQYKAISNGTFAGLYVGDYWVISGVTYRIAGFDYYLHNGDTDTTKHHAVIVPDENMGSAQMNTCLLYTSNPKQGRGKLLSALDDHSSLKGTEIRLL